ncbi:HET-domain-containing protein [Zopfia rhizophila CBS 207.26]|uniref:HET-domain-containing protein n=1 Tax=Zopfia rhizophila CBS 207.26 TaxID=1314779 RepID=A0A6A6E3Q2_9PEZI|nr:HET-domain-containing protein [Zopfia rhizophila CBS 207.26]
MHLLLRSKNGEFSFAKDLGDDDPTPPYAILSHTWGLDGEEVTFEDITNGTGKNKRGYNKIWFCGAQAEQDGLRYLWIDTCCINKKNKAELSHAINSMFRWYRNATRCYDYLSDVSNPPIESNDKYNLWPREWNFWKRGWFTQGWTLQQLLGLGSVDSNEKHNTQPWESQFRESIWFTRGWTLQELLAPGSVEFLSQERKRLGDRSSLTNTEVS